ncbi:unnamed protein product [Cladocopium goreaui]|uniref:Uncharacterized protein n=1 Tax=Cladocopium goreaui TaxID=2562237 RepID=A0A9P1BVH1_9DINO|nr:unnamed protein product [Cladocopium goreaui]
MTWRGSKVLRVAALQAGRTGTDARFVGRWWGSSLTQLGADLGCVSEIGLSNSQLAPLLLEGFSDAGFTAICHGPPEEGLAPRGGAGVALVVRRSIISTWSDISRDRLGRCIASTLYLSSGLPLRVIGVYAITGSSLPGFEGNAFQVAAESQLVRFIQEQLQAADVQGMTCLHCVCLGVCSTVERMSLLVAASSGGLQIPSVVESVLAAAASDLLLLLSGYTTASILARDALQEVLFLPGAEATKQFTWALGPTADCSDSVV